MLQHHPTYLVLSLEHADMSQQLVHVRLVSQLLIHLGLVLDILSAVFTSSNQLAYNYPLLTNHKPLLTKAIITCKLYSRNLNMQDHC